MSATIFIKPAKEDAIVRMPERAMRPLKAAGEPVDNSFFWQRRLLHGDVVRADAADSAAIPTAAEAAAPAAAVPTPKNKAAPPSDGASGLSVETTLVTKL